MNSTPTGVRLMAKIPAGCGAVRSAPFDWTIPATPIDGEDDAFDRKLAQAPKSHSFPLHPSIRNNV
jgi:hypothetical protein